MTDSNNVIQLREFIRILERKLGILGDYQMSCCEVTMSQCHALVEIGRAGSISLNELAELLNIENSSMSRTVNNLVNSELVIREVNPQDRRYVTITLTDNGKNIYLDIENRMTNYFKNIYERLPLEKREQVIESLELLLNAIEVKECC